MSAQERRFQAFASIALGSIIVGLCGLCTYNVSVNGGGYGLQYIVGGVPILAGLFLVARGLLDIFRPPPPSEPDGRND